MWRNQIRSSHHSPPNANTSLDQFSSIALQTSFNFSESFSSTCNRSIITSRNQLNVILETDHHTVQNHGSVLPVLLIEAISSEVSLTSISVNITDYGWAWLVTGRRLFIWKYLQSDKSKIQSFELTLPPSELVHKADLVALVGSTTTLPGALAVSPEGIIRYWPNATYPGHSIETNALDIQGQECFSLTFISNSPPGFILGTTTSSLMYVGINGNNIETRMLRVPHGMLAGIGAKVSSFIFGGIPSTSETRTLVKILGGDIVYVCSGCSLQKWIVDNESEKLFGKCNLRRLIIDAYLRTVWNRESTNPSTVQIFIIDVMNYGNALLLLVAGLNIDSSNLLHYGLGLLDMKEEGEALESFTIISFENYYPEEEEKLLSMRLLKAGNRMYVYNSEKIMCVTLQHSVVDTINLSMRNSSIIGAGVYDEKPLIFTSKDNLVSIIPNDDARETSVSPIELDKITLDPSNLENLRNAFRHFRRNEMRQCNSIVTAILPSFASNSVESLDDLVMKLSEELCDETTGIDPRWAEGEASQETSDSLLSNILLKFKTHFCFIEFLKTAGLWDTLSQVNSNGRTVLTQLTLCEHAEKLIVALTLKKFSDEVDLGLEDEDYKKITKIHEQIEHLVDTLGESVADIVITAFQETCRFRQNHGSLYAALKKSNKNTNQQNVIEQEGCEYVPLTVTVRTSLLKLIDCLTKAGAYGKVMDLSDLVLDGYVCQMKWLEGRESRYEKVMKDFEKDRKTCLKSLLIGKQWERVASLAEKYEDFEVLVKVCDELDNYNRLERYLEQYKDKDFAEVLVNWYVKEGKRAKMLKLKGLGGFLKQCDGINWLHCISTDDWGGAAKCLKSLADREKQGEQDKRQTILSLGKLCDYASGKMDLEEWDQELEAH